MRHKKKRVLELSTGVQKQSNVVRNMLTNLVTHGEITTTGKRAKVLKAQADSFFARLVTLHTKRDEADAKREAIRSTKSVLYTDEAGKKLLNDILPRWISENKTAGFVTAVKCGPRPGDAAERVLVRIV